jgi:heptaprenyl diphosphate synthase
MMKAMKERNTDSEKIYDGQYLKVRQLTHIAMLVCLAMVLSYLERLIPLSVTIPGIKLGLANLVVLVGLYLLPFRQTLMLVVLKCVMASWIFGSFAAFLYSLSGSLLSFAVMSLLLYGSRFRLPVIAVSIVGAVCHNIGQLLTAALILHSLKTFYYLPVLTVAGVAAGAAIGICVRSLLALPGTRQKIRKRW